MFRTLTLASLAAAYVAGSAQAGVLAQYTFGTVESTTFAATTIDPLLTASDLTGNNTGLNIFQIQPTLSTYPSPVLLVRPIAGSTSAANAVSNGSYFSFTVGPASVGTTYSLTNLTFDAAKGGSSGTRGWVVRSSADSYASDLGTSTIGTVRPTFTNYQVSLAGLLYQDRTDPITFRIYTYTPGDTSSVEYDNITLNGSAFVPEPSTALALSGFTYNSGTNTFNVSLEGAPNTAYILEEAADLDFGTPDQSPIPLDGATATVGALDTGLDTVTTDGSGNATVTGVSLGAPAKDATFIRAETAP